jgi:hypothetical protein
LYFLKGELPWLTNDDRDRIFLIKSSIDAASLFEGVPDELRRIYTEVRQMKAEKVPEYARYRKILRDLFLRCNFLFDYKYDWLEVARTPFVFPRVRNTGPSRAIPKIRMSPRPATATLPQRQHSRTPLPRTPIPRRV